MAKSRFKLTLWYLTLVCFTISLWQTDESFIFEFILVFGGVSNGHVSLSLKFEGNENENNKRK